MAAEIIRLLQAQGGAASARDLLGAGFSRRTVEAMVRRGELVRVRRDALVLASELDDTAPWRRYAVTARAVGRSLAPALPVEPGMGGVGHHALSHQSALALRGLPTLDGQEAVHLVRTDGVRGRRDRTIWVHRPLDPALVTAVDGLRLVRPAVAALQVATTHGPEAGLVCLDGVLHRALRQDEQARAPGQRVARVRAEIELVLSRGWLPESRAAHLVAELADPRSESPGESRCRWLVHALGLGPCTPQFVIDDGTRLLGIADLKLDRWDVLVEFDGTDKYTGPGSLLAEKDREDGIRSLGYEFVRVRWSDFARPRALHGRILAAIARAESRARRAS